MTTIRDVLAQARQRIKSPSASLDAQLLLCEVLHVERSHVIAYPERVLTAGEAAQYEGLVARRASGEPIAYILGRRAFYDREFRVTPAVLIPRPETEDLLQMALDIAAVRRIGAVVDVGTGSGALAVTFAAHHPNVAVYAVDISRDALAVARQNADAAGVTIRFMEGDLLEPLAACDVQVDVVMANLPYIAHDDLDSLEVSRFEPLLALDGGPDGLSLVRRLLDQSESVSRPGTELLLEIGADQGAAALALGSGHGAARIYKDLAGHDRILRVTLGDVPMDAR